MFHLISEWQQYPFLFILPLFHRASLIYFTLFLTVLSYRHASSIYPSITVYAHLVDSTCCRGARFFIQVTILPVLFLMRSRSGDFILQNRVNNDVTFSSKFAGDIYSITCCCMCSSWSHRAVCKRLALLHSTIQFPMQQVPNLHCFGIYLVVSPCHIFSCYVLAVGRSMN